MYVGAYSLLSLDVHNRNNLGKWPQMAHMSASQRPPSWHGQTGRSALSVLLKCAKSKESLLLSLSLHSCPRLLGPTSMSCFSTSFSIYCFPSSSASQLHLPPSFPLSPQKLPPLPSLSCCLLPPFNCHQRLYGVLFLPLAGCVPVKR